MRTKELITIKWKVSGGAKRYGNYSNIGMSLRTWEYSDRVHDVIEKVLEKTADDITKWMKANAPWTDRTKKARSSLMAQMGGSWYVDKYMKSSSGDNYEYFNKDVTQIIIGYIATADPVWYAWYLETIQAGKWAIVGPALDEWGPIIWQRVKTALGMF